MDMVFQEDLRVGHRNFRLMQPVGGQPSYEQLLAENRRLKQQLAEKQSGIHVDVANDRVTLRGLETEELKINELEVAVPGLKQVLPEVVKVSNLTNPDQKVRLPDLARFARFPMRVETMDLSVTEQTLNQILAQQKVDNVSDLHLAIGNNGRLRIGGDYHKIFTVPFQVEGQLKAVGGSRLRFDLEKTRLAGLLPIPNIMTNLFASLATHMMSRLNVTRDGSSYVVDLKGYLPANLSAQIDEVATQPGLISLRAGLKNASQ